MNATENITTEVEEKVEVLNVFFISIFVRPVIFRVLNSFSCKIGIGTRINSPQFRRKQRAACYSVLIVTSPWGWIASTQGY